MLPIQLQALRVILLSTLNIILLHIPHRQIKRTLEPPRKLPTPLRQRHGRLQIPPPRLQHRQVIQRLAMLGVLPHRQPEAPRRKLQIPNRNVHGADIIPDVGEFEGLVAGEVEGSAEAGEEEVEFVAVETR